MTIDLEAARIALCERLIEYSDDKTYHRIANDLREAEACITLLGNPELRPLAEYHEDMGTVLWWKFPIVEPPWVGTPNTIGHGIRIDVEIRTAYPGPDGKRRDGNRMACTPATRTINTGGWPGYHTHFTPLPPMPKAPA